MVATRCRTRAPVALVGPPASLASSFVVMSVLATGCQGAGLMAGVSDCCSGENHDSLIRGLDGGSRAACTTDEALTPISSSAAR